MKAFTINSFRFGVDRRREILATQPGTLYSGQNVHITSGGEIEKRKAFVNLGKINTDTSAPEDTFGLESTNNGLVVFTGDPNYSVSLNAAIDDIIVLPYPRLLYPWENPLDNVALESVRSITFNGIYFAAATYVDNTKWLYHDEGTISNSQALGFGGLLVWQSKYGQEIFTGDDNQRNALELGLNILDIYQWKSQANFDEYGVQADGSILVKSPPKNYYSVVDDSVSTAGTFAIKLISTDGPIGASGVETKAIAAFQVVLSAPSTGSFTSFVAPDRNDLLTTVNLTSGSVAASTTAVLTANAIASAINDLTFLTGYSAQTNGSDSVSVYAPSDLGDSINGSNLVITTTGGPSVAAPGTVPTTLAIELVPAAINVENNATVLYASCSAIPIGGTAPYTYVWEEATPGSGNGITIIQNTDPLYNSSVVFKSTPLTYFGQVTGAFKCTVTDVLNVSGVKNVTVRFAFRY